MNKPPLLLEVEQALAAANEAKAQLEAFDKANPDLSLKVQGHRAILQGLKAVLRPGPRDPINYVDLPWPVHVLLNDAILRQEEVLDPINAKWNKREALAAEVYDTGRAYTNASTKWDSSAERFDYLKGQGLMALSKAQE
jgi:hypothetical protein